ncbi:SPX domain-containing protein [Crepidotus variabilis]|uniref:SPX domain-containing protein n=1 Tax=Crepidotus variabilis TaxID=179855 RepID=A0A9P6E5J9_9AGAR|nr:SPX domain-containing protein [Crepidotus variabilis]
MPTTLNRPSESELAFQSELQPEFIPLRPLLRSRSSRSVPAPADSSPYTSGKARKFAMKFSSSLKFNAVSEWWEEYIAYDALKKYIYQLEKQQVGRDRDRESHLSHSQLLHPQHTALIPDLESNSNEHTSLLPSSPPGPGTNSNTDALFTTLLNRELHKIESFYALQAKELLAELEELERDVELQDLIGLQGEDAYGWEGEDDEDDDEDDEEGREGSPVATMRRSTSGQRKRKGSSGRRATVSSHPPRRLSTSSIPISIEEASSGATNPGGLDQSILSLHSGISRKPTSGGTLSKISTTLVNLKDSITSATSPILPSHSRDPLSHSQSYSRDRGLSRSQSAHPQDRDRSIWSSPTDYAYDIRLLYKRRITHLFISLTNLRSYIEINHSGFRKILKKYDKVLFSSLLSTYLPHTISTSPPFSEDEKRRLGEAVGRCEGLYAKCVSRGDLGVARQQLKLNLRENIAWERDTVWRQMIGRERRGETLVSAVGNGEDDGFGGGFSALGLGANGGGIASIPTGATLITAPEPALWALRVPFLKKSVRVRITKKRVWKLVAVCVLVGMLNVSLLDGVEGGTEEAGRCLAVLAFCTILWATEAIPLFVTSMFVPLLLITLRVITGCEDTSSKFIPGEITSRWMIPIPSNTSSGSRRAFVPGESRIAECDGGRKVTLSPADATKYIFSIMFSPTIMLLIGGFTISSALSKTNIDRVVVTRVLSLAGTKPSRVLLAFMGVSCFASMWISNVAAPTLCFSLIRPILRTLPPRSSFAPCLILGIALAANIGGQSSPISSPQNLIAMERMDPKPDWGTWFAIAIPVSLLSILLIWLFLLISYKPHLAPPGPLGPNTDGMDNERTEMEIEIKPIRPTREPFSVKQYWVVCVCVLTIGLWCVEHRIHAYVGDMGVIAIIPIVAFFSTGVLKKDDFDSFMWTIVFLAMGGIALGKGVVSSGLLEIMDVAVRDLVSGYKLYTVVLILSPIILVISTFISHTIASVLLVPIAQEVGNNLGNHANVLIFITGLICSCGMGMPVSGFPNQTAATQENELGELYLTNVDFLKNGVPASIIATLVVATLGFALMKLVGI